MDTLHDFFRAKEVPFELRKSVRLFYDNLLRKKTVFDEGEIIASLPPALANDVIYTLYSDTIMNTPMFVGLEPEVISKLCMRLTPFHAPLGTQISQEGYQGTEVYLIQKGEVLISRGGVHLAVIGPGSSFGEMSALGFSLGKYGNQRDKTATSVTDADLVFITGEQLYSLMEDYESLRISLRKVVERRMKGRRKDRQKALDAKILRDSTSGPPELVRKHADMSEAPTSNDVRPLRTPSLSKRDVFAQELDIPKSPTSVHSDALAAEVETDSGRPSDPATMRNASPAKGALPPVNCSNSADMMAEALYSIDQKLGSIVQEQSALAQCVAAMEQSMAAADTGKLFASPTSTKFDVADCARRLMRHSTNRSLASLPNLANGMGLSDGLPGASDSSSDEELRGRTSPHVRFALRK